MIDKRIDQNIIDHEIHNSKTISLSIKEKGVIIYTSKEKLTIHHHIDNQFIKEISIPESKFTKFKLDPIDIQHEKNKKLILIGFNVTSIPNSSDKLNIMRFGYLNKDISDLEFLDHVYGETDSFYRFVKDSRNMFPKRSYCIIKDGFANLTLNSIDPHKQKITKIFELKYIIKSDLNQKLLGVLFDYDNQGDRNMILYNQSHICVVRFDLKTRKICFKKVIITNGKQIPDKDSNQLIYFEEFNKAFYSNNYELIEIKDPYSRNNETSQKTIETFRNKMNLLKSKKKLYVFPKLGGVLNEKNNIGMAYTAYNSRLVKKYRHLSNRFYYGGIENENIQKVFEISPKIFTLVSDTSSITYLTEGEIILKKSFQFMNPSSLLFSSGSILAFLHPREQFLNIFEIRQKRIEFIYEINVTHLKKFEIVKNNTYEIQKVRFIERNEDNLTVWIRIKYEKIEFEGVMILSIYNNTDNDKYILFVKEDKIISLRMLEDGFYCIFFENYFAFVRYDSLNGEFIFQNVYAYNYLNIKRSEEEKLNVLNSIEYYSQDHIFFEIETNFQNKTLKLEKYYCGEKQLEKLEVKELLDDSLGEIKSNCRENFDILVNLTTDFNKLVMIIYNGNYIIIDTMPIDSMLENRKRYEIKDLEDNYLMNNLESIQLLDEKTLLIVLFNENSKLILILDLESGKNKRKSFDLISNNSPLESFIVNDSKLGIPWRMKKGGKPISFEWCHAEMKNKKLILNKICKI